MFVPTSLSGTRTANKKYIFLLGFLVVGEKGNTQGASKVEVFVIGCVGMNNLICNLNSKKLAW